MPKTEKARYAGVPRAAAFQPKSRSRKLAPVIYVDRGRPRLEPVACGPFVATTYVSRAATCSRSCPFYPSRCYVATGAARALDSSLDTAARNLTSLSVIRQEAALIFGAFGGRAVPQDGGREGASGRDCRLHVCGDVRTAKQARLLAGAAADYVRRGGGVVWAYTRRWREIPRTAWGLIRVLASLEDPADIADAHRFGYDVALTVPEFAQDGTYRLHGTGVRVLPCSYETQGTTCVECRACFGNLRARRVVIGFAVHGPGAAGVKEALTVISNRRHSSGRRKSR